jgi:hypothetical protein
LGLVNPLIKAPIEFATQRRTFLGMPMEEARRAPAWVGLLPQGAQDALGVKTITAKSGAEWKEWDPDLLWALDVLPWSRISRSIAKGVDQKKPWALRVLNLATGLQFTTVDQAREEMRARHKQLVKTLEDAAHSGQVHKLEHLYALSPAAKKNPQLVAAAKGLRRAPSPKGRKAGWKPGKAGQSFPRPVGGQKQAPKKKPGAGIFPAI